MNRFFTLLLAASCLTAVGQVPDYVPTENLIAWWSLDGHALDAGGNAHDGILVGPNSATDRHGNPSGCLDFSDGDRIEVPTLLQHTPVLSVAFWLELDAYESDNNGGFNHFFNKWGNQNTSFICSANSNALYLYSGNNLFQSDDLPSLNEWHHIAFVINPPVASIYIDGQQVHSFDEIPDVPHMPSKFVQIGGNMYVATYNSVDGRMDDLGFWGRALSGTEIAGIYQSSLSLSGCTDEAACNYSDFAVTDNGSCDYSCCPGPGCCHEGTIWDSDVQQCISANTADINNDGCVQLNDLLDLLSAYGDCGAEESPWQCGDPLEYQGYDYETVQIGEQCWFAENCRYLPYLNEAGNGSDTEPRYYILYENHTDLLQAQESLTYLEYGALYNLPAVLVGEALCPSGWHIPNIQEWEELGAFAAQLGPNSLKDESWDGGDSGFDAKAAGHRADYGDYIREFEESDFWSVTVEPNCVNHVARLMTNEVDLMTNDLMLHCESGNSVRCIKD